MNETKVPRKSHRKTIHSILSKDVSDKPSCLKRMLLELTGRHRGTNRRKYK